MRLLCWRVWTALALAMTAAIVPAEAPPGVVIATPDLDVTLRTEAAPERRWFMGVGGTVAGVINPTLSVRQGAVVRIVLVNGDDAVHNLVIPALGVESGPLAQAGAKTAVVFRADKRGHFEYFCSTPGHKEAGMVGVFTVGEPATASRTGTGKPMWFQSLQ